MAAARIGRRLLYLTAVVSSTMAVRGRGHLRLFLPEEPLHEALDRGDLEVREGLLEQRREVVLTGPRRDGVRSDEMG
jgi:hypothetical protein